MVPSFFEALLSAFAPLYGLKITKASMLDELFRDHARGGFQSGGERFVLYTEHVSAPDCSPHF
jgi:hypothetical protein